jgi:hypothetical protein
MKYIEITQFLSNANLSFLDLTDHIPLYVQIVTWRSRNIKAGDPLYQTISIRSRFQRKHHYQVFQVWNRYQVYIDQKNVNFHPIMA